jgi:23S rRNA (guanosine2251-2'-O)-methyltransferase
MIIYGINAVSEAMHAGVPVRTLYIQDGKDGNTRIAGIAAAARRQAQPIAIESVPDLKAVCRSPDHQGVAAELESGLDQSLPLDPPPADHLVILDGIQDPHNFGACLRVCEVFGFSHVVYHQGNSSGITSAAIKVSAGAAFHIHLYQSNLTRAVRGLQSRGYLIITLDAQATTSIYVAVLPAKFALVMGSEGDGVRHAIRRLADESWRIPIRGRLDSLNVSCALSATLSDLARRLPATP